MLDDDGHPVVGADADESVRLERPGRYGLAARAARAGLGERSGRRDAEREARAGLEEIAPAQVHDVECLHAPS